MTKTNFDKEVKKIGGSLGLIIPVDSVKKMNLKDGQIVEVTIEIQ